MDPTSDKFNHDSQVFQRTQKFIADSIEKLHSDPVSYLTTNNREIKSALQDYRTTQTPEKFNALNGLLLKYQGTSTVGEDASKFLNLSMHEVHLLDKSQSEQLVSNIVNAGPRQGAKLLHDTINQYDEKDRGIIMSDLVNHGKLPIESYAVERTYGAPFNDKLMGSIMSAKSLRETVGRQKGSTPEDLDKVLDTNNTWLQWSKLTAADNFQRQDVVAGFRGAIQSYAMGMIQDGKPVKEAIAGAVNDLTQWGHQNITVNGRTMQVTRGQYSGTDFEFAQAVRDSIGHLDISRIKLTNDNHSPIFPVLKLAGHQGTADEALRFQIQNRVVPNLNPDGRSFSLYYHDSGNLFQLRDKDGKPFNMNIEDLPTYTYTNRMQRVYTGDPMSHSYDYPVSMRSTHWPTKP